MQEDLELHQQEEALLTGLLRDSPPPIVALGPATLQHAPSARLLRRHAQVVYVRHSMLSLYGNLLDELDGATRRCWLFPGARPQSVGEIQPTFARYRKGYESAGRTLDAAGRSPVTLAGVLVSMFTMDQPA